MAKIKSAVGSALVSLVLLPLLAQAQGYKYTTVIPGNSLNAGLECTISAEKACACAFAAAAAVCVLRGGLPVPSNELPVISGEKLKFCEWSAGCVFFEWDGLARY